MVHEDSENGISFFLVYAKFICYHRVDHFDETSISENIIKIDWKNVKYKIECFIWDKNGT